MLGFPRKEEENIRKGKGKGGKEMKKGRQRKKGEKGNVIE